MLTALLLLSGSSEKLEKLFGNLDLFYTVRFYNIIKEVNFTKCGIHRYIIIFVDIYAQWTYTHRCPYQCCYLHATKYLQYYLRYENLPRLGVNGKNIQWASTNERSVARRKGWGSFTKINDIFRLFQNVLHCGQDIE